jgi:hypothetical protein
LPMIRPRPRPLLSESSGLYFVTPTFYAYINSSKL